MNTSAREEQILIGYLLGVASEVEQTQIETRYFREPAFYEEALVLEEELIYDYLRGALSFQKRRLFEQNFLRSPRRRRKYEETQKLMAFVAERAQRLARPAQPEAKAEGLFPFDPSLIWGIAAILFLGVCVWWLGLLITDKQQELRASENKRQTIQTQGRQLKDQQSKKQNSLQAKQKELQTLQELAVDSLTASLDPPVAAAEAPAEAFHTQPSPKPAPVIVAFTLSVPRLRAPETPQRVALPADTDQLHLSFKLSGPDKLGFLSYNAALKTTKGQIIAQQKGLSAQAARQLTLEIPAKSLKSGIYVLTLTGVTANKEAKPADDFFIQITRS